MGVAAADSRKMMSLDRANELLGHPGEDATRKTDQGLGWEIMPGPMKV